MSVPDPPLTYPTDRVVGIAGDREVLRSVRRALAAAEVDEERVDVLCNAESAHQIDPDAPDSPVEGAVRTVQKVLGEESRRLELLSDAIEDGAYVVTVAVPDRHDHEVRHQIGRVLHDAGASHVAFYGQWRIEELQLGA